MPDARAADLPRLEVRKTIHAPRAAVFKAWTTPDSIARWFSSPEAKVRHVEVDTSVGGKLLIECDYKGGVWRLDGVIQEYHAPGRLSFTWVSDDIPAGVGSLVTVDLTEAGGRTELLLTQTGFPSAKKHAENEGGWNELMANLAKEVTMREANAPSA